MNKVAVILLLLIGAAVSIVYGIYRSTTERVILTENNRQITYGEPQHGLIIGLFVFASACVLGVIWILLDRKERTEILDAKQERPYTVSKTTATNYPR